MLENKEVKRYRRSRFRDFKFLGCLVNRLVADALEGAPVNADRTLGLDVPHDLQGFLRVQVRVLHEPARLIGADGNGSQIKSTHAFADVSGVGRVTEIS